jgi:hypothetical protein
VTATEIKTRQSLGRGRARVRSKKAKAKAQAMMQEAWKEMNRTLDLRVGTHSKEMAKGREAPAPSVDPHQTDKTQ